MAMLVAALTIFSQLLADAFLQVDLGVNVDVALAVFGLNGGVYVAARKLLKAFLVRTESKHQAEPTKNSQAEW